MRSITTKSERFTVRENKSFSKYLNEIQAYEPLDAQEEYELASKMMDGDRRAKDKLIKHNLRFVVSVAKQYYGSNIRLEDLVNEGNIGLLLAADKYDPSRGFKFISYAVWWIRREIISFLNNRGDTIRVPVHKTTLIGKIKNLYTSLEQKLNRVPTDIDLVNESDGEFSLEDVNLFFTYYVENIGLLDDSLGGDTSDGATKGDRLTTTMVPEADTLTNETDSKLRISFYLELLKPKQREVMVKFFGLHGGESQSMESISLEMGVSKERIRQLKEQSLEILKAKSAFIQR
jgi:RNA polymerase primary sigma factor